MTWNEEPMSLRVESTNDFYTISNGQSWGSNLVYYQNLPTDLKEKMPLYGTQDINTGNANLLYLPTKTYAYMFRKHGWQEVDMTGWTEVSMGSYFGGHGGDIRMYTREYEPGTHIVDNFSAMYLFDPDY